MSNLPTKKQWSPLSQAIKQNYRTHILAWETSNLTQNKYCQQHNLNKNTFYYLRSQILAQRKNDVQQDKFIPLIPKHADTEIYSNNQPILIRLSNSTTIELPANIGHAQLAMILNTVRMEPC